ncbi:MAG: efflux RND transporter periplasmic adaptor subunit [Duganella sp.]
MKLNIMTLRACTLAISAVALVGCDTSKSAGAPKENTSASSEKIEIVHKGNVAIAPVGSPVRARLKIAQVESLAIERPVQSPGTIEAAPEAMVNITTPLAGRIVKVHRTLGDKVQRGDPLFTLDSAELNDAYNEASKSQASALQAQRELTRQQTLFDAGIASAKEHEAAQLASSLANNDRKVALARLKQLGASAGGEGSQYVLRAPMDGRVIDMAGAQGGFWNDITVPMMKVADLRTVFISAQLAEKDVSAAFVGQKARIAIDAYPQQPLYGTVKYVGELVDPETRTVKVRMAVDNSDGHLRPGMFARVTFAGRSSTAVVVPASALQQGSLSTYVYVETAPSTYAMREVVVGATLGDKVEIVSGLREGERIVVKEGVLLND